jgi:hypothetical protein
MILAEPARHQEEWPDFTRSSRCCLFSSSTTANLTETDSYSRYINPAFFGTAMLSTLSSFLPSALSDKLDKFELHGDESVNKEHIDEEGVKRRDMAEEANKKEKKKKSSSNEASTTPLAAETALTYRIRHSLSSDRPQPSPTILSISSSSLSPPTTRETAQTRPQRPPPPTRASLLTLPEKMRSSHRQRRPRHLPRSRNQTTAA